MSLHYFPAHRQSNSCTFMFAGAAQALENSEDTFSILLVKADTVVFHNNLATFAV